ncbi:hypothetical protein B0H15DRAFT_957014 [Mycena belliarum]|uniref:Uncharacterized protein n=1 Tax=Mycena belliarum TaxID=1033014 RepID=A0AAD6TN85_9AGAR|nr:hypothetical protein B0H15DRAFT_957014 [Mycena belliae]
MRYYTPPLAPRRYHSFYYAEYHDGPQFTEAYQPTRFCQRLHRLLREAAAQERRLRHAFATTYPRWAPCPPRDNRSPEFLRDNRRLEGLLACSDAIAIIAQHVLTLAEDENAAILELLAESFYDAWLSLGEVSRVSVDDIHSARCALAWGSPLTTASMAPGKRNARLDEGWCWTTRGASGEQPVIGNSWGSSSVDGWGTDLDGWGTDMGGGWVPSAHIPPTFWGAASGGWGWGPSTSLPLPVQDYGGNGWTPLRVRRLRTQSDGPSPRRASRSRSRRASHLLRAEQQYKNFLRRLGGMGGVDT